MKKRWFIIVGSVLAVVLVAVIIATANKPAKEIDDIDAAIDDAQDQEEMIDYGSGIGFDEEVDGAELTFAPSDISNYYGTWKATSDQAIYLYGKVELTIKEDNTWTGIVVDENMSGTWEFDGESMKVDSEFFNVTLQFTEDGTMIMQEDREGTGDYINTVLTKQ